MAWRKLYGGSGKNPDEPTVHFTKFGGRYVKADELLRSEKVREQLRSMAELFRNDASRDGSGKSGRKNSCPERPAGHSP